MRANRKGSTIKNSKEEIWFWYCHLMAYEKSKMQFSKYCRKNNLDAKKFQNVKNRLIFCKEHDLKKYNRYIALAKAYSACDLGREEFCSQNSCDELLVGFAVTHLNYLAMVEDMRASGASLKPERPDSAPYIDYSVDKNDSMSFIKVGEPEVTTPEPNTYLTIAPQEMQVIDPVIIPQQNKIELTVAKGVKIEISPDISSEKILSLINLLKDI